MSVIDKPINLIIKYTDATSSTNTRNFNVVLNIENDLMKYRLFKCKLIDFCFPHTVSTTSESSWVYGEIVLNNINYLNQCSSNSSSTPSIIGRFNNSQYSIIGEYAVTSFVGYDFVMYNPERKTINIVVNLYDASGSLVSTATFCPGYIALVIKAEPYFLSDF